MAGFSNNWSLHAFMSHTGLQGYTRHQDVMENLSDMQVILDFLEEHYGQTSGGDGSQKFDDIFMTRELPVDETCAEQYCNHWEFNSLLDDDTTADFTQNTDTLSLCGSVPSLMPARQPSKPHAKTAGGRGGKLRLFRFLFEVLEDPGMAHCVSWVLPASAGVFRFSSRNKEQVAVLWGQRKGNKRPMTYEKMSRALRNYARSGEIFKVKKKLTYQFSRDTLWALTSCHHRHL